MVSLISRKSPWVSRLRNSQPQNSFSRVARTDKGVHAAGQIVALRMRCNNTKEGREEALQRLNAELPPTIRCLWIQRVPKGFDARHAASARHYEYLLPTRVLRPREVFAPCPVSRYPKTVPLGSSVREAMVAAMRTGDGDRAEAIRNEAERHLLDRMGGIRPGREGPTPSQVAALYRGVMRGHAGSVRAVAAGGTGSFSAWTRQLAAAPAGPSVSSDVSWVGQVTALVKLDGKLVPVCLKEAPQPPARAGAGAAGSSSSNSSTPAVGASAPSSSGIASIASKLTDISRPVGSDASPLEIEKRRIAKKMWKKVVDPCAIVPSPATPPVAFAAAGFAAVSHIAARVGARFTPSTPASAAASSSSSALSSSSSAAAAARSDADWLVRVTGPYVFRGNAMIRAASRALRARNARWGYRIDDKTLASLREAWGGYIGSHSFHNFTPHLLYGDSQAHRTMRVLTVSDPFLVSRTGILPGMQETDRAASEATMRAMLVAKVREHKMARRRRLNRKRSVREKAAAVASKAKVAKTAAAAQEDEDEDEAMEDQAEDAGAADTAAARAAGDDSATAAAAASCDAGEEGPTGGDDDEFDGVDATTVALEAAFAKHDAGMSSLDDAESLQPDFVPVSDAEVEEARRILNLREPPADLGLLTQEDLEKAGPEHAMEFVRFTVIGQSFLLNQIRHMVGLAVEFARGACNRSVLTTAFGNCNGGVPLAPAEGLFLHTALFTDFNRRISSECQPLTFTEPECVARQLRFKEQFIWAHIARQCAVDQPFERWRRSLEARPFHYRFRKSASDGRSSGGAVSKAAISLRQHRMSTNSSSASRRGPKGSGGVTSRGRGRGRTDRTDELREFMGVGSSSKRGRGRRGRGRIVRGGKSG